MPGPGVPTASLRTMNEFNEKIIEEFRANGGKVGGGFEGAPLLLLTTTGAKTGQPRVAPLAYLDDGDRLIVFGSKAGAPTDPDWIHNIRANPEVGVEVGTDQFTATAVEVDEPERSELFARQVAAMPPFADYEQKSGGRVIPVVALQRVG